MEIRNSKEDEKKIASYIWRDTFNDDKEYIDWYFENIHKDNNLLLAIEKNKIIGMTYNNSYKFKIENYIDESYYILAVGVVPERRGEGIMKSLLQSSLKNAKGNGSISIFLSPIDSNIYTRFGFEYISNLEKYSCSIKNLSEFEKKCKLEIVDEKNIYNLVEFCNRYLESFSLATIKTEQHLKELISETLHENGKSYIVRDTEEGIIGYVSYILKDDVVTVKEILSSCKKGYISIFNFLYGYSNYYSNIVIYAPTGSNLNLYFKRENSLKKEIIPKMQMRILDVFKTLELLKSRLKSEEKITIKILDDIFEENDGIYEITKEEVKKSKDFIADCEIKVGTLSQIIAGYLNFMDFLKLERINILNEKKIDILDKIIVSKKSYFNQEF